jgi:hypothetical protein
VPRARRPPRRRKALRPPRAVTITPPAGALTLAGAAPTSSPLMAPERRSVMEAIQRLVDRLPKDLQAGLGKFPVFSVPYVIRGILERRLDHPRTPAGQRRQALRLRNEIDEVIEQLKGAERSGSRPRGFPAADPLDATVLATLVAEYRQRTANAKAGPEIWRAMAAQHKYPNWTELRRQVTRILRSR